MERPSSEKAVVKGPGEGERFTGPGREIVVKAVRPELDVLVFDVGPEFDGPGLHYHEQHVDSFFVLAGELEVTLGRHTVRAPAGTAAVAPPGVVHTFAIPEGRTRFLNVHAPERSFVDYLRARHRGESFDPLDADIHDVDEAHGEGGTLLRPGEGPAFTVGSSTSVFRATREATAGAFSLSEVTIEPGTSGPPPHFHRTLLDSFYVLAGTLTVLVGDEEVEAPVDTYVCAPPGVLHTFINRSGEPVRCFNLNTPGGWEDYIRDLAAAMPAGEPPDPQLMGEILARYDVVFPHAG